jgi:hypothetical protein
MSGLKGKRQLVKTREPSGAEVVFVVEPRDGSIVLDQVQGDDQFGYRGHFSAREAADLGAALLMAAGSLNYR